MSKFYQLSELAIWSPGLRRILIHKSAQGTKDRSREPSISLFKSLDTWLKKQRRQHRNEPLDEEDIENDNDDFQDTFCGTGYVVVTTYENIRRSADVWTQHHWNYIILDEGLFFSLWKFSYYNIHMFTFCRAENSESRYA